MKKKLIARKPFEFSARVTLQLGRESISSSTVAISELIKNSYDADAEEVHLGFLSENDSINTLVITDNGTGMDSNTLFTNWLKIGTNNKSITEYSDIKKRVLTGAKGLGRLGLDRLCEKLVLYTKTSEMKKALELTIEWKSFEDASLSLSQIQHDIYEVDLPFSDDYGQNDFDSNFSGTRMILHGLKDNWNEDFMKSLEKELKLLVSPFKSENEFTIYINKDITKLNETKAISSEEYLSLAKWNVEADVSKEGLVSVTYKNNATEKVITQGPIIWANWIKDKAEKPLFGPLKFKLYHIPRESSNVLKKLNLRLKDLREFMNQNQGVRIYRDHFRVRPYGEPSGKGDWLDLGHRKISSPGGISQGGWRVGPNQIIASVIISRTTNSILNDQANREGLVENEAYYQLRTFLLKVIESFEHLAHKDASNDKNIEPAEELANFMAKARLDSEEAVNSIRESISTTFKKKKKRQKLSQVQIVNKKLAELEKITARQAELEKALFDMNKKLEQEKNTLSNLASLGILTVSFGHEIRQHSGLASVGSFQIENSLISAKKDLSKLDIDKCINTAYSINKSLNYIQKFSDFALKNIKYDKRTRKEIVVPDVFEYVFNILSDTFDSMNFRPMIKLKDNKKLYIVKSYEIDWESIAINLITNSIWALEDTHKNDRKIEVHFSLSEDNNAQIIFADSGKGIEEGTEESIFMPMSSGKRDSTGNVIGTGMGLSIIKTQIEDHIGGSVTAVSKGILGGAEFKFLVPVVKK